MNNTLTYSTPLSRKNYLIVGATGSLGQELVRQLLNDVDAITCLSRDELKQSEMKKKFKNHPMLNFVLGDIRDYDSIYRHFRGIHVVYHVAALKQIDVLELNPEESIRTNILGTINVADACEAAGVERLVFSTTDKAVDPINAYGMCKGLSERLLHQRKMPTKIFRWGNVMGSRGSAIHGFARTLKEDSIAYITDPRMTRFWIKIENAVRFMLGDYTHDRYTISVPSMKAAKVTRVISSVARILGIRDFALMKTDIRPGEKLHEVMSSIHSAPPLSSDSCEQYSDEELDEMVRSVLCPS